MSDTDDIVGRNEWLSAGRQSSHIVEDNNAFLLDSLIVKNYGVGVWLCFFHNAKIRIRFTKSTQSDFLP